MVESPADLLDSLERAIEDFHQIRQELRGEPDAGRRVQEEPSSVDAMAPTGLSQ
jgi:hypothetical protein